MKSAADVFKMALFNEVKAQAFYVKAAELTKNDESRMLFLQLGNMEDDHARGLIRKAAHAPCSQEVDLEAYLKELEASMDATITAEELGVLENGSVAEVLHMAINLEKTARETYHSLAEKVQDDAVRLLCVEMAAEENRHTHALMDLLSSVTMDSEDRPGL